MNRRPLQLALREMQAAVASRYKRLSMLLAIVLLTVSGPFGTFQSFDLGQRLLYWAAMVIACFLVGQGSATFAIELLRERITQRWPRVIVGGLVAAIPVTIVAVVVNAIGYQHFEAGELFPMWLYVTIVTLVVVMMMVTLSDVLAGQNGPGPTGPEATSVAPLPQPAQRSPAIETLPAILERVPLPQRGRLLALIVEDHYVDIVTDKGKALVLMRLADAIREAAGIPGLQIHRSHWVATAAVVRTLRNDGKLSLELSNGLRLPVSRGFLAAVRAAGLG